VKQVERGGLGVGKRPVRHDTKAGMQGLRDRRGEVGGESFFCTCCLPRPTLNKCHRHMPHGCVPDHRRVTSHSLCARNNQTSHGNGQSPTLSFPNYHFTIKNSKMVLMYCSCRTQSLENYFIVCQKMVYLLVQVVSRHLLTNP
jgi:hypothetical protein